MGNDVISIFAKITGLEYTPLMCQPLNTFDFNEIDSAISQHTTFVLKVSKGNQIGVSYWVAPKRTRSYPYVRVYDSLGLSKRVTIIPAIKDGLLKMMLFTNLKDVQVEGVAYNPVPILKLTTGDDFRMSSLGRAESDYLTRLKEEAKTNGFRVMINQDFFV